MNRVNHKASDRIDAIARNPVPRMHLRPVTWNPFDARLRTVHASDVIPITAWSMIGLLCGSMLNKATTLTLSTIPGGMDALPLTVRYAIAATAGCIGLLHGLKGVLQMRHDDVIVAMRSRVTAIMSTTMQGDWYGDWMRLRSRNDSRTTEIEFRIDAIGATLAETLWGMHDEDEMRRADETASLAIRTIVLNEIATLESPEEHRCDTKSANAAEALDEFQRFCARMIDPDAAILGNMASTAEKRAAALIADAEDALALRPDLVDRNHARIDDLVRVHLPRMVRIHTETLPGATPEGRRALDSHFDTCLELARLSIEESYAVLQDERFDASLTELRFMRSRRGEIQDDPPIGPDPVSDRGGGPGMTRAA